MAKQVCLVCGVKIRRDQEGFNNGLCEPCYDAAGIENEHQDGYHTEFRSDCPMCESEVPEPKKKINRAHNAGVRRYKVAQSV